MKKLIVILIVSMIYKVYGNNLQISSVSIGQLSGGSVLVSFNISWENSWRNPVNWDAAWVFIKYKISGEDLWKHATLSTVETEHIVPTGCKITPTSDGKGVFIYRNADGTGTFTITNIQLKWNYSLDNVTNPNVAVKVIGIEMVYIPEGPFYIGDGDGTNISYNAFRDSLSKPVLISNILSPTIKTIDDDDQLKYLGIRISGVGGIDENNDGIIEKPNFPTGYKAFYCMKYEITQGQYTDFLNMLTRNQQKRRVLSNISHDAVGNIYVMSDAQSIANRNVIRCPSIGNGTNIPIVFSCSRPDRACNFMFTYDFLDALAYADWSALRPMTELEYEKACRGPNYPTPSEYAWGNTSIIAAYQISGEENGTEKIITQNANCNFGYQNFSGGDVGSGPLRVGIFATSSTTTREQSGASYYGVMEMSGNIGEQCVSISNSLTRSFDGSHGNGELSSDGNTDNSNWLNTALSLRGGSWESAITTLTISFRNFYYSGYGFRFVRSTP
jgi:formylglycine-generating enzyme required for sulfatase activity